MQFEVQSLITYPLKSAAGITLSQSPATPLGLEADRHWMLISQHNTYLSQRQIPGMVKLAVEFTKDQSGILICHPNQSEALRIDFDWDAHCKPEELVVTMHRRGDALEKIHVLDCGSEASRWFTEALGPYKEGPIRMVAVNHVVGRPVIAEQLKGRSVETHLADGFPYLVSTIRDLDYLNHRLVELGHFSLEMRRFRPNIVLSGGEPWDIMQGGQLTREEGSFELDLVKPCERCLIIRTNQDSGERDATVDLLKSVLPEINQEKIDRDEALFGQNAILSGRPGSLKIGDKFTFKPGKK